jgi:hypothetical protein
MNVKIKVVFALTLFTLLNCQRPEDGISPIGAVPQIPRKPLIINSASVEFICHVDLDKYNPLNVKDYYLAPGGMDNHIMIFDYVVFGHAYLVKDSQGYVHLQKTEALQYVLDNNSVFIKPMRKKGIKVLIEIRSGNYADVDAGEGLGLGTLDMAAIQELIVEFTHLVTRYEIDGYEFNDAGGGYLAYPPYTRNVKRFQRNEPLYPDSMFRDKDNNPLSDEKIEDILWIEGGSNISNLIYMVNEVLKESHNTAADYGSGGNDGQIIEIKRSLLARDSGHGGSLISQIRMEYMPDAYSGASANVVDNLTYFIRGVPNDNSVGSPYFFNETTGQNDGIYMNDRYGPLNIDLSERVSSAHANTFAQWFKGTGLGNKYGVLYFSNLPSVTEAGSDSVIKTYLNQFTQELFGWTARMYEGGGDNKKTW